MAHFLLDASRGWLRHISESRFLQAFRFPPPPYAIIIKTLAHRMGENCMMPLDMARVAPIPRGRRASISRTARRMGKASCFTDIDD